MRPLTLKWKSALFCDRRNNPHLGTGQALFMYKVNFFGALLTVEVVVAVAEAKDFLGAPCLRCLCLISAL